MASTTAICDSFLLDLVTGTAHDFTNGQDVFRWSLYTSTATNGSATTVYTATNEISGTNYVAKGETGANVTPTVSTNTAMVDFADPTWTSASFTAASTLLFNDTDASDSAVAVWNFTGDQTASGGDFVLEMPVRAAGTAILTLA